MTAAEHDDATMDAIALVEAVRGDRADHIAAVLRHMNSYEVALTLAKLMCALVTANESGQAACAECFRDWATSAIERDLQPGKLRSAI